MTRSTNNPASRRRRKRILERSKGFRGARRNLIRLATESTNRAMAFAYRGRKEKKRDFRALWITRISVAAKANGVSYSRLMDSLKKNDIVINRKMLAEMAVNNQSAFAELAALAK
ncbi:MAG: 50S ribosomal protein L20 [bacterium]|nr:50S ribosomal protein L20 [bacterium]